MTINMGLSVFKTILHCLSQGRFRLGSLIVGVLFTCYANSTLAASLTDKSPNAVSQTPTQTLKEQLIDIDLPVAPGTNWWLGLEWALIGLMVVMILAVLYGLRNRYWRSFYLRWQLKKLKRHMKNSSIKDESFNHRQASINLYAIFDIAKRHQLISAVDMAILQAKLDPLCFSQHHDSRETLLPTTIFFQQALHQTQVNRLKKIPSILWQKLNQIAIVLWTYVRSHWFSNRHANGDEYDR